MTSSLKTLTIATAAALALGGFSEAAFASPGPTLTLSVESPTGVPIDMVYRAGDGWRSLAGVARPTKIALAKSAASAGKPVPAVAQPLAVVLDRPSGGTFVYLPDQGWKFAGRSDVAKPMKAALAASGKPMTMFVDGPTGFTFTYAAGTGWKYVGRVGERNL